MLYFSNKNHLKSMKKNLSKLIKKLNEKKNISLEYYQLNRSSFIEMLPIKPMKKTFSKLIDKLNEKKNSLYQSYQLNPSILIEALQDKLESVVSSDTDQIVLKQSRFWARSITWVLMGGTAFGIGWLTLAETEEIVQAQGKLEPSSGVVEVQMPLEGVTREILVKEGERVSKGQVLIRLDTDITQSRFNSLQKNLEINNLILKKLELLVKEGAVSELQYLQQILKVKEIESDIKTNSITLKYQEIISPIAGIVFQLEPKGAGFVARTSQPVLKIVPTDRLLAKVEIDNRSIGFVQPGKNADINIHSFPASDFGVLTGKLKKIGSDALPPMPSQGKGYRFAADIELDNQYLLLQSGEKLPLQAGMSLTANIKLRKVTYLQLLLKNFRKKSDSLKAI